MRINFLIINLIFRREILNFGTISDLSDINLTLLILTPIIYLVSAIQTAWAPDLMDITSLKDVLIKTITKVPVISLFIVILSFLIYLVVLFSFKLSLIPSDYHLIKIYFFTLFGFIFSIFTTFLR